MLMEISFLTVWSECGQYVVNKNKQIFLEEFFLLMCYNVRGVSIALHLTYVK